MTNLVAAFLDRVAGRRVLVTGHTGFKGAWLSEWLLARRAKVTGIALPPDAASPLFELLGLERRLSHVVCDIRDAKSLCVAVQRADPEIVFHLAAQALVRRSYRSPVDTWQTNVIGTLNVLEAVAALQRPVTVVVVTTDKVYHNIESNHAYCEEDPLGGHDPYSASKAGCEIATQSWRMAFAARTGVRLATARAGNVLGGGDMNEDRIVPDCYRAWARGEAVQVRNPSSTRPWQHVLEPLSGYIALAEHLDATPAEPIDACNFGPLASGERTVGELVEFLAGLSPKRQVRHAPEANAPHEAGQLSLSIDRARRRLGWSPRLSFEDTLRWTDAGYSAPAGKLPEVVRSQIENYQKRDCL